jgi:hypothetical protein
MIQQQLGSDSTQWAGCTALAGVPEFIRLTLAPGDEAALDRPGRFQFRMALRELRIALRHVRFGA